jgi:hydroxymethylglutaryl-CoA lyase
MLVPDIIDVTLRDGLMARRPLPTHRKIELVSALLHAGITQFEVARFPIDGVYPQFHDGIELLGELQRFRPSSQLSVFAMGEAGVDAALEYSQLFDQLHTACFVSPEYTKYALGFQDWDRSLRLIESFRQSCVQASVELTIGLGTSFGCPIRQRHNIHDTLSKVSDLKCLGIETIMLGDTAGTATPRMVHVTLSGILPPSRPQTLRCHFHNTFGRALLNAWAAVEHHIDGLDSSLLGLGGEGHPYFVVPEMVNNGNLPTEDVLPIIRSLQSEYANEVPLESASDLLATCRSLASHFDEPPPSRSCFASLVPLPQSG